MHALQLSELELARSVLEPRTPDADADPFVVRARLLVDLRTKDYTSIGPAVRRYIDTLATDRPVNDSGSCVRTRIVSANLCDSPAL